ncbi:Clr5 domain-containing protein [Phyllosticta capitalensis]
MSSTWESHKQTIRGLYLAENMPLKQVIAKMTETHDFSATQAQYELQLKKWGFRKNLTAKEWATVSRKIDKRKLEGRDSEVIMDGQLVPKEKVRKKTSTYGYQTTLEKLEETFRGHLKASYTMACNIANKITSLCRIPSNSGRNRCAHTFAKRSKSRRFD